MLEFSSHEGKNEWYPNTFYLGKLFRSCSLLFQRWMIENNDFETTSSWNFRASKNRFYDTGKGRSTGKKLQGNKLQQSPRWCWIFFFFPILLLLFTALHKAVSRSRLRPKKYLMRRNSVPASILHLDSKTTNFSFVNLKLGAKQNG